MRLPDTNGAFYLGQRVQQDGKLLTGTRLLYDTRDLTTHGVCVGMTGCGKTGLGIILIEEAALAGIPTLVVDPKGDMTNVMLAFPDLRAEDFRPWVDVEGARRRGLTLDQYAQESALSWQAGLAEWGIDRTRVARLGKSAEFTIYTPGSDAGRKVNIVHSLHVPALDWDREADVLREMIASTVSALLALVDIDSDPITGREHILLSTIIERAWRAGRDVDLAQLIVQVQKPSIDRLGVLPLETFYPESHRRALTLALNGLLASPKFAAWMQGDPLSVEALLRTADGRNRVSIFTLSHLEDAERSFFVTLLLQQVRSWLRFQQGTPDLCVLLYFDELYGYMPPHPANPPTKRLLLALLKQARSQGMGLVLATQNPVDLDYKGLSNAGTWFLGKLQTVNDRQRVLEGLIGASLASGVSLERAELDKRIAQLDARMFLLHNVHADETVLFKTRHTMSYLRGPLSRAQIRRLSSEGETQTVRVVRESLETSASPPPAVRPNSGSSLSLPTAGGLPTKPLVLSSGVRQYFMPVQVPLEWAIRDAEADGRTIVYQDKQLVYRPALYARVQVLIESAKYNVREKRTISRVVAPPEDDSFVSWDAAPLAVDVDELDAHPAQDARFGALPALLGDARRLKAGQKDFEDFVYREVSLELPYHPVLRLIADPGESPSQFKRRCYEAIRQRRDAEIGELEKDCQEKIDRLDARIRREERELYQDEAEFEARKREEVISAGESVLNLLSRRRHSRMLSTASRKRRLTQQARADVEESGEAIEDLEGQIDDLLADLARERAEVHARWSEAADDLEVVRLRPTKADIYVQDWGVVWVPYWDIVFEDRGSEHRLSLAAFGAVR